MASHLAAENRTPFQRWILQLQFHHEQLAHFGNALNVENLGHPPLAQSVVS